MIRNIVFDMGNVLMIFDPDKFIADAGVTDKKDAGIIRNQLFLSTEWISMDRGEKDECDIEEAVLKRIPERLHERTLYILHNWHRDPGTVSGMMEIVRELKEKGYRILLLSNASHSQHSYWKGLGFDDYFDGTFISADEGLIKPMPEIYDRFIAHFGLKQEECVFIDDSPANVETAVMLGWHGIVFHGDSMELRQELTEKGLL